MIVNNNSSGAITSSGVEGTAMRIKASGKFYKAMLDSLYQDKPGSIVRELATNALDAHRVAGNVDRPFIIHLPDMYEPWFGIRDFGCSMTDDQIHNVYSVLFESSKDNDNTQAGGYGLGGKNFLSYQDSGTIITYLNGKKNNYVLMYDESGMPKLFHMGVEDTAEENGVYVELAIKDGDYNVFHDAVVDQLKFFKVKPILNNNSYNTQFDEHVFKEEYDQFKVFSSHSNNPDGFWIVQGEVGYPLDLNEIKHKIKDKHNLEFFNAFYSGALYFDIGDILVTVSRENIQYDAHTINSIERFIEKISPIITKNVQASLAGLNTPWEKIYYLNSNPDILKVARLANIDVNLSNNINFSNSRYYVDATFATKNDYGMFNLVKGRRKYFDQKGAVIYPNANIELFIRDIERGAISRLKHYENCNPTKTIYVIEHRKGSANITGNIIKELEDQFGGLVLKKISSLPEPPKNSKAQKGTPVVYEWNYKAPLESITRWDRLYDEEDIENGYYVVFDEYPYTRIPSDMARIINLVTKSNLLEYGDDRIFAIKSSKAAIFEENINMVKLTDKIDEIIISIKDVYKDKSFVDRYIIAKAIRDKTAKMMQEVRINFMAQNYNDILEVLPKGHPICKIVKASLISSKVVSSIEHKFIKKLSKIEKPLFDEMCNRETNKLEKFMKSLPCTSTILKTYPALNWINNYYYGNTFDKCKVLDYIKLVDASLTLPQNDGSIK